MKLKKVEVATLAQLDHELGTTVYMDTYESLCGLIYESENEEDYNYYDSDGNVLYFASCELEDVIETGLQEYRDGLTKPISELN
jgi:uncharacterized protein YacL (UPF0231 family)